MTQQTVKTILCDIYGVSVVSAPVEAIEWALDRISVIEVAKKELKVTNATRRKYGKMPYHVPYGHRLF